ncbi:MAG TPA: TlpA disulfide reductase family protein [Pyrinomonadaceae bacterium]|nr:TlpA disulfide reductase family protein [Pyrinomonadaceae bacterium]
MRLLTVLFLSFLLTVSAFAQSNKNSKPLADTFTATSLDEQTVDLAALKGKVVLITFWSTKCPICTSEIPKLNQMAAKYNGRDVVFLGLTTDNDSKVKQYIKKKPFNFNLLPNSFGILLKYADKDGDGNVTMGYPAHYLINQTGEIELKTSGFDKTRKLDAQIDKLLK